ncbi:MAG: 5'-methylthioadenosine/S-adenosylhomocysteine nucleosidase [Pseudomonadota bacterium]
MTAMIRGVAHQLGALVALFVVTLGGAEPTHAARLDETPRMAVISAFPPEWQELTAAIEGRVDHEENGVAFVTGRLEGRDVVLFLSGVSVVNAAMTTQLALDRFNVTAIVFSGIAGGVDPTLTIGDIIVPKRWGPYLHMVLARDTDAGYVVPPFYGKPFKNFGMIHPQPVSVRRKGQAEFHDVFWFEVDPQLMAVAEAAASAVTLSRCAEAGACLDEAPEVILGGNGVSGSAFVDNAEFRDYVFTTFEASILDMESAAVAQVAYANAVPFIAIRSLSDLAGGGEGENELPVFFGLAAGNAAAMVKAFLAASETIGR